MFLELRKIIRMIRSREQLTEIEEVVPVISRLTSGKVLSGVMFMGAGGPFGILAATPSVYTRILPLARCTFPAWWLVECGCVTRKMNFLLRISNIGYHRYGSSFL